MGNEKFYNIWWKQQKPLNVIGNIENEFWLPTYSKAFKPQAIIGELEWRSNFTKYSKDNPYLPWPFWEYFDTPIDYDIWGPLHCWKIDAYQEFWPRTSLPRGRNQSAWSFSKANTWPQTS